MSVHSGDGAGGLELERDPMKNREHVHVDRGDGAVSDRAAQSTSESEASIEIDALRPALGSWDGSCGRSRSGSHCDGRESECVMRQQQK